MVVLTARLRHWGWQTSLMPMPGLNTYKVNMVSAMETPEKMYRSPESTEQRDCMNDFESETRGDCMVGVRGEIACAREGVRG